MTNANYGKLTAGLIAAWFTFSLTASALHWFNTDPERPPLPLLLAVVVPLVLFSVWYWSSKGFREFVLSLNPRTLTLVQAWRIAGFVFVVLYSYRILPGEFALPAGWGDMFIGATALIVALKLADPNHRTAFVFWQILGITDLVVAISSGALARYLSPQQFVSASGVNIAPMTLLPLSVIPTFAVPLLLVLHIICIAQARRWSSPAATRIGERLTSAV
jgi:hypothetical protein